MNKVDYDNTMRAKLETGPYKTLKTDPLPGMVKRVDKALKECALIFGDSAKNLKVSNPALPRIKGLPKIHKEGNQMREIIAAEGAPTQKLAKWLVGEFQSMPKQFPSRSVKNTQDFARKLLKTGEIAEDEVMVSFDVVALFPSIPVSDAINHLEDWLLQQEGSGEWSAKVRAYIRLTRLCMEENFFTFRGEFFQQTKGAPMGNPLSPFLSELFMANLEKRLEDSGVLPRRWWRYVDDVFSIVKKVDLPRTLEIINRANEGIQFTYEHEENGRLPFLDILVIRGEATVSFEVYRKPTHTMRTIPNTSSHTHQHKMAAFNHMLHRMESLPLSQSGKEKELTYILKTAQVNGYPENSVRTLLKKRAYRLYTQSLTTLSGETEDRKKVSVNYDKNVHPLKKKLKAHGIDLVFSSRSNQLKTILGSTKDPIDKVSQAGVYKINCSDCNKAYIGQTKRSMETRFKEHVGEATRAAKKEGKSMHWFKSKVAEHISEENHTVRISDVKILRKIGNPRKLDVAESLEIAKHKNTELLNRDSGNSYSWLFKLIKPHS